MVLCLINIALMDFIIHLQAVKPRSLIYMFICVFIHICFFFMDCVALAKHGHHRFGSSPSVHPSSVCTLAMLTLKFKENPIINYQSEEFVSLSSM